MATSYVKSFLAPRRAVVPALLLNLALLPTQAAAKDFELGLGLGVTQLADNVGGKEEARYELRAGYLFSRYFELELQYAEVSSVFDRDLTLFMVNAVFNLRKNAHLVPYTLVGAGRATWKVAFQGGTEQDDGFAYQSAVGLRLYFGEAKRATLRLELSLLGEEAFYYSVHKSLTAGLGWRF